MSKKIIVVVIAQLVFFSLMPAMIRSAQQPAAQQIRHISPELQKYVETANYKDIRIKKFPVAVQSYTFRRFTFFDTLQKVMDLGVNYVQAYHNQPLAADMPKVFFNYDLTEEQQARVKEKLKETGITLLAYGVVDIGKTEESMRKVFNFARKMGIRTIIAEPADDDFSLLEKLVKEYNIQVAIHNHPEPSKYNLPETVYDHVRGKDDRIGACADNGHWMRGLNDPREAFKLLEGRILDVHLKDRSDLGIANGVDDVPWGQGKANIRDLLAELTLQDYDGFLTIEYENEEEADNPVPAIRKSIEYVKSMGEGGKS